MQLVLQVLCEGLCAREGLFLAGGSGLDGDLGPCEGLADVEEGCPVAEVLDLLDPPGLPDPLVDPVKEVFLRKC